MKIKRLKRRKIKKLDRKIKEKQKIKIKVKEGEKWLCRSQFVEDEQL